MNKQIFYLRRGLATVIILLVLLGLTTTLTLGAQPNPRVYPPNSRPYGLTYGQWSALWWVWAFSIPQANSPLFDSTGQNCDQGQTGPVWFLAGTFEIVQDNQGDLIGEAERDCTIPVGTAIFFPILNAECSTIEGNGTTEEELRNCAVSLIDTVTSLSATIDGVRVENLDPPDSPYRVQSPLFVFALPPGDILGKNTGTSPIFSQSVSDGYWVMLKPLSVGQHTVQFTGSADVAPGTTFSLDITYHLNVVNKR